MSSIFGQTPLLRPKAGVCDRPRDERFIASEQAVQQYPGESPLRQTVHVGCIDPLPSSTAARAVLRLDRGSTITDYLAVIRCDPALTARLLKAANSATFGRQEQIFNLSEAAQTVGFPRVKGITIAASGANRDRFMSREEGLQISRMHAAAIAAELLAREVPCGAPEEMYLHGLLYNIGSLLLIRAPGAEERGVVPAWPGVEAGLMAGAVAAAKWRLPNGVRAVLFYSRGSAGGDLPAGIEKKVLLLRLARSISGQILPDSADRDCPCLATAALLGISGSRVISIRESVRENLLQATTNLARCSASKDVRDSGLRPAVLGGSAKTENNRGGRHFRIFFTGRGKAVRTSRSKGLVSPFYFEPKPAAAPAEQAVPGKAVGFLALLVQEARHARPDKEKSER